MHLPRSRVLDRVARPVDAVRRWPVASQQQSRRNAMIASTALAQRRADLEEVEEFLAGLGRDRVPEVAAHAAHG